MPFVVGENFRRSLLTEPESGMGYQRVRRVDEATHSVILNAELGLWADEGYRVLPHEIKKLEQLDRRTNDVSGVSEPQGPIYTEELETVEWDSAKFVVEIHGSYASNSQQGERFIRYNASRNDRRILTDGSVLPGTYATTDNDAQVVPSGLAVVGRYALPNQTPAIYRFVLVPPQSVPITCGTVAPAFGQAGGGVEACFIQGTAPGTLHSYAKISER